MPLQGVFFLNQLHLAFGFSQKIKICCEILSQSVVSDVLMNLGVTNSTPFLHISGLITSFNQKLLELQNDCKKGIFLYQGWFNTGDWLLISHTINWIKSIWTGKYPCTATVQRFFIFFTNKNWKELPDRGNIMARPAASAVPVHSNYVKQRTMLISWDITAFHLMNWKTFMSGCNCLKSAWLSVNQHACYSWGIEVWNPPGILQNKFEDRKTIFNKISLHRQRLKG